ncbi:MAG: universal stress protein UspA [Desulfobulbaceae bacterium BRH_c16a]|nr:MAG: universal stress protein UspA [Desulfobulbaceae bacterium BRH_c16a]
MIYLKKSYKIATVSILILIIAFFDYTVTLHLSKIDLVYRDVYVVPIILGSYWFGKKGGLFTSLASSAFYLPCAMLGTRLGSIIYLSNMLEIVFFIGVGYFVGSYYDLRKSQFVLNTDSYEEELHHQPTKNILFCIHSAENTSKAARYIVENFPHKSEITITVMGLLRVKPQDFFDTKEEFHAAFEKSNAEMSTLVDRTKTIICQGGVSETNIRERMITVDGKTTAERILEEQHRSHYDMIIAGCTKKSKAQEFLFGNTNVTLVREAPCPVLVVC